MKKFTLLCFTIIALLSASCSDSKEDDGGKERPGVIENGRYRGTVSVDQNDGHTALSGDGLIPTVGDAEVDRYTVTELSGTISGEELTLEMKLGTYPTKYTGTIGDNNKYIGTITVEQTDGTEYIQEDVAIEATQKDGKADLLLIQVSFADRMPKMDITIPGVDVKSVAGTIFKQENVELKFKVDGETAKMEMLQVSFSDKMPVKLDMTIEGIKAVTENGTVTMSGDNIIPTAMGGKFEEYTITGMSGKATDNNISFEFMCGPYPLTFTGTSAVNR